MGLDDKPSMPTNAHIYSELLGAGHDAASVRSLLFNMTFLNFNKPQGDIGISIGWRHNASIQSHLSFYLNEFNVSESHAWGTACDGSKQTAYDLCRFMLGREEWAKKTWYPFYLEHVLFWRLERMDFNLETLYLCLQEIVRRL